MRWFIRNTSGGVVGPVEGERLTKKLEAGEIPPGFQVRREGSEECVPRRKHAGS